MLEQLYHGSPKEFTSFKLPGVNEVTNGKEMGFGVYLTNDYARACRYANDGYVYDVALSQNAENSRVVYADRVSLLQSEVTQLVEGIAKSQIEEDEYPYILSDWAEPTSETEIDSGNHAIAEQIAQNARESSNSDLDVINDLYNQCGGDEAAARLLQPRLNDLGVHFAVRNFDDGEVANSREYIIFDPNDLRIERTHEVSKYTIPEYTKYVEDNARLLPRFNAEEIKELDDLLTVEQRRSVYSDDEVKAAGLQPNEKEALVVLTSNNGRQKPMYSLESFKNYPLHGQTQDFRLSAEKRLNAQFNSGNLGGLLTKAICDNKLSTKYPDTLRASIEQASYYAVSCVLSDRNKHFEPVNNGFGDKSDLTKNEAQKLKQGISDYGQILLQSIQKQQTQRRQQTKVVPKNRTFNPSR